MTGITSGHRRRTAVALITVALLSPLLVVIPLSSVPPARAASTPDFTFVGGGWGHGVGLSQYGAYAMAKIGGMDRDQILSHYYTGTAPAELGVDIDAAQPLWVNLEREATAVTVRHRAIGTNATPVTLSGGTAAGTLPNEGAVTIEVTGTTPDGSPTCRISTNGTTSDGPCFVDLTWDGDADAPTSRVVIESVRRSIDTDGGAPCTLLDWNAIPTAVRPCTYSRGSLHIRPDDNTASFHVVLEIDVEDYVLGISEMPYYWSLPAGGPNGVAALEAQAIAARSYAIHRQLDRGRPEERPSCWCQLYDTAIDQRYVGWGHSGLGQQGWLDAVRATEGIVRTHPDERKGGRLIPIEAFYGSSSYGKTEPSSLVFVQKTPYLASVEDHWSIEPAAGNPEGTWTKSFSGDDLAAVLGWGGGRTVSAVEVASCSPAGTISEVRFVDAAGGSRVLPARSLRSLLGLRSPQITSIGAPPPSHPPCGGLGAIAGIAVGGVTVDDDTTGDSRGDASGTAACDEIVELEVDLVNGLSARFTGVTATLRTDDPHVTILHNDTSGYPRLSPAVAAANDDDWDIAIAPSAADGHVARLSLAVRADQGGPWVLEMSLPIECGGPSTATSPATAVVGLSEFAVDDGPTGDSVGNGDGRAQCGETVELYIEATNTGSARLDALSGSLTTADPYLTLLHNVDAPFPALQAGATGRNTNDWDVAVSPVVPSDHVAALTLRLTTRDGLDETFDVSLAIDCIPPLGSAPVLLDALVVDDGIRGDSVGNNDRRAQCGETIELYAALVAVDRAAAANVTARLSSDDPNVRILYNTESRYPALSTDASTENLNDWDIEIADPVPDGHVVVFQIDLTTDVGPVSLPAELSIECAGAAPAAPIAVETLTVDDGVFGDSIGNNDRRAQCGETVELYISLVNRGGLALDSLAATLSISDPRARLLYNTSSTYPTIGIGGMAENGNDWDVAIADSVADGATIGMVLAVTSGDGERWELPVAMPVACP